MKKISTLLLIAAVVVVGSYATADHHEQSHEHSQWFDDTNCDVCKPWSESPQLMMVTKWETHVIKNGMLMVSSVPKEQLANFRAVCKKMDATIEKMAAGEEPKGLCGFCEAMGGLTMSGAKSETVNTEFGNIILVTADKPETVKAIHAVAKRTQEEAKKMAAMMKKPAA